MHKPTFVLVRERASASLGRFKDDEGGSMAIVIIFTFLAMILFGGIAVDVMRFETRRVAMQQTLDRAALAAASLPDDFATARTPTAIANDWFAKVGLGQGLFMVEYSTPTVTAINVPGKREVTMSASVRSHNFFMGIFSPNDYLEGPTSTQAAQGVSNIEVMLVLDITGSMDSSIGGGKTKIQALREAATSFVDIVKGNDKKNGVSIGIVPYAAQVNMNALLRQQFNAVHVSSWNGIGGAGVPNIDCLEIPTSTYTDTALSRTDPIPMSAVADSTPAVNPNPIPTFATNSTFANPVGPTASSRACSTVADNTSTTRNEATANHILLPTKNGAVVKDRIAGLVAAGNTNIAIGMRWGTALIDETARPIYTNLLSSEPAMAGRPADNGSAETRKVIILMTDGEHVTNTHVVDQFKSGPSPIYRGAGNPVRYAIRYWPDGGWHNDNARPACAGTNQYFVPHLKRDWVDLNNNGVENTGERGACDPQAWRSTPSWPNSGTVSRLDWSEVWRYLRVSYVAQQLYLRSNVANIPVYNDLLNQMRQTYMTSVGTLNSLLQDNCTAARNAGFEIYGIAFASGANGAAQINGCASEPKITYYYNAANNGDLLAAFNQIATDISDLRLTQ
jgi:Flp pilus assembly protein TadG